MDLTLRDFHICANNQSLTKDECSRLVFNCIKSESLEFYLKVINPQMPYQIVVDKLRSRYNKTHRQLSLQSEVDSLSFDEFMALQQIQDCKECLRQMVKYLNNITPQLVDSFHTELNKIRYLLNAVFRKKWATTLKNISTVQYNFDQLVMSSNESSLLECEIQKASISSKTNHDQFRAHPKEVRKYDSSHMSDSRNHGEYLAQRYDDPYRYNQRYQRERS